jgi:hypothetical protein
MQRCAQPQCKLCFCLFAAQSTIRDDTTARAQIWDLQLSAATTYYIVVSGYANETGSYTFTMASSDSSDSELQSDSNVSHDLGSDMDSSCASECGAELLIPLRAILDRCDLCAPPYPPTPPLAAQFVQYPAHALT